MASVWCIPAAAVLLLAGVRGEADPAPPSAVSVAGQHVLLAGTIKRVETGPQAVLFTGDNGRDYVLDLSAAKVILPPGAAGLKPGMRGTVSGMGNSDGSIAVSRFQAFAPPASVPVPAAAQPLDYTVRGTVESVSLVQGAFVLRVKTHVRTVFVTPDTDTRGLLSAAKNFPVQPGQRVTVGGSLQPSGTVLAAVLTDKTDLDYRAPADQANRVLFGPVSATANKLRGRDFRIRVADGTEWKIVSTRSIPIRREGHQISVYDLSRRDTVRVIGRLKGTDFQAARVDVLAPVPEAVPVGGAAPTRPGL